MVGAVVLGLGNGAIAAPHYLWYEPRHTRIPIARLHDSNPIPLRLDTFERYLSLNLSILADLCLHFGSRVAQSLQLYCRSMYGSNHVHVTWASSLLRKCYIYFSSRLMLECIAMLRMPWYRGVLKLLLAFGRMVVPCTRLY